MNETLAGEYGFLDAKHGLGYDPRPSGFEAAYDEGYRSGGGATEVTEIPVGSYADKTNWGWY